MRDLPNLRPERAIPPDKLIVQSLHLIEHSRIVRGESRQLRAHYRKVCEQASQSAGRAASGR